jgi:aquaporin Z
MGHIGAGLAFGFAVGSVVYTMGATTGGHVNPAVTIAFAVAGRFPARRPVPHLSAQILGGILAAALITLIALSTPEAAEQARVHHLGASGWQWGMRFPWWVAFDCELVASIIFTAVFLAVRTEKRKMPQDGFAIGMTAAGLHFVFLGISGASLDPSRSISPALFAGGAALDQLWLYIVAPILGGAASGFVARCAFPTEGQNCEVERRGLMEDVNNIR